MDALDFGRARVLSPQGVRRAARRWYEGEHGPEADGVRKAHASCSTCGFFVPLAGPLRRIFGICANEWAADDGRVVIFLWMRSTGKCLSRSSSSALSRTACALALA